jgi:hypothetical protein
VVENRDSKLDGPDQRKRSLLAGRKTWRREINAGLRQAYDAVVNEPVPEGFRHVLGCEEFASTVEHVRQEPHG